MITKKILSGHISPETALVIDDYPYGFRLRCKIRYWLEHSPTKGTRLLSQTSNPKRGDVWNKPKASTYSRFGGAMFLDENNHVQWSGVSEYSDLKILIEWKKQFGDTLPDEPKKILDNWIKKKFDYEILKKNGKIAIKTTINGEVKTEILPASYPKNDEIYQENFVLP